MFLEYKYQIEVNWNDGSKLTPIPIEHIRSAMNYFDYDKLNMPILYLTVNTGKQLIDKIVLGKQNSTFMINIRKVSSNDNSLVEDYIKDEFLYFLVDDINYTDVTEYTPNDNKDRDDVFRRITFGCIKLDTVNKNKKLFNGVYRGVTNMGLVLWATEQLDNLIIEPMLSSNYDELIVPPIDTLAKLLNYLNERSAFYTTDYRYFLDYDKSYIMSSSGIGIPTRDDPINDIIISVCDPSQPSAYIQGVSKDDQAKAYVVPVNANESRMYIDTVIEKSFNSLYGITGDGNTKELQLNLSNNKNSVVRNKYLRVPYENLGILDIIKNKMEIGNKFLTISKANMDCSILTMNKRYSIRNYDKYSDIDGDYIIASKKEVFVKEADDFINNVIVTSRSAK